MIGITISSIRINGVDRPINTPDDLRETLGLIQACLKFGTTLPAERPREQTASTEVPHDPDQFPFNTIRAEGERSIDYARRAVAALPQRFTLRQIADKMTDLGWETKAQGTKARTNTVRATIRNRDDFVNHHNGTWSYSGTDTGQSELTM